MAKRFTDTEIWEQDWFIEMPKDYKLFWFYMKDLCNHAGIFKPNIRRFCILNECDIDINEAFNLFNTEKDRIEILENGRWLIRDFFVFQYGAKMNIKNRVHLSINQEFKRNEVNMTLIRGLKEVIVDPNDGVKDKDKEKDKDIDKELIIKQELLLNKKEDEKLKEEQFEIFWNSYDKKDGRKKCLAKFLTLKKEEVIKIIEITPKYVKSTPEVKFRKHPITWLNGEHWEDEITIGKHTGLENQRVLPTHFETEL